jgi:hypothetical protein
MQYRYVFSDTFYTRIRIRNADPDSVDNLMRIICVSRADAFQIFFFCIVLVVLVLLILVLSCVIFKSYLGVLLCVPFVIVISVVLWVFTV